MKLKKYTFPLLFSSLFLLNSCQKDIELFVPDSVQPNQPDTNWVSAITPAMPVSLLKASLLLPFYTDSFTISSSNTSLGSASGLTLLLNGNTLVNSQGQSVTGNVLVETLLLKKKGDIIRMDMPTTSNGNIFVSAGEILLRFKKDSAQLSLSQQGLLSISYADSVPSSSMKLFFGDEGNPSPSLYNWILNADSINQLYTTTQGYTIRSTRTGWLALGQPIQNSGQAVALINLPSQYTNANTIAYLVNRATVSVIKMNGDAGLKKFTTNTLPYGNNFTVIIISKQGDNYFLGHEDFFTPPGSISTIISVNPVITSFDNIINFLDSL